MQIISSPKAVKGVLRGNAMPAGMVATVNIPAVSMIKTLVDIKGISGGVAGVTAWIELTSPTTIVIGCSSYSSSPSVRWELVEYE